MRPPSRRRSSVASSFPGGSCERGLRSATHLLRGVYAAGGIQRLLTLRQQFQHGQRVLKPIVLPDVHEHDSGLAVLRNYNRRATVHDFANELFRPMLQICDGPDICCPHRSEYSTEFCPMTPCLLWLESTAFSVWIRE